VALWVEVAAAPDGGEGIDRTFTLDGLGDALARERPDLLIVEQWAILGHIGAFPGPVACDAHGSLLLENLYRRGGLDAVLDAGAKIDGLRRADLVLVPNDAQRHHLAAWLTVAGFDPRELPLAVLPLAAPLGPEPGPRTGKRLHLVYGGARWPWIDSLWALRAIAAVLPGLRAG
jgi:hypothetical protein